MARIRTVKPEFFRHEGLQDIEAANPGAHCMLVFAGLWGHCDKGGVFEWRPRTLKLDILPFLEFDMADTLAILESAGFVQRYEAEGKTYGVVPTFEEHQRIGGKELQEPVKHPRSNGEAPEKQRGSNGEAIGIAGREGKGREKEGKGDAQERAPDGLNGEAWTRWLAYRSEIRKPLKPASIPAAQRSLAAFGSDQAAVVEQSVANGWQGLFPLKTANGKPQPPPKREREPTLGEIAAERAKAAAQNSAGIAKALRLPNLGAAR